MDLHDGNFDFEGHPDGTDPAADDWHADAAHSMIATGYEGPGTSESLSSGLDGDINDSDSDINAGPAGHAPADGDAEATMARPHSHGSDAEDTDGHDIDITINGQQFEGRATLDSDGDGHADTALVTLNAQGNQAALADFDGDGHAEHATIFDPDGQVIDHAHLNAAGTWVEDDGDRPASTRPAGAGSSVIGTATVRSQGGGGEAAGSSGEAIRMSLHGHQYETTDTRDADHDGTADTGILPTSDGGELVVTDTDGDGIADHARIYGADGQDQGGIFVTSSGETVPDGSEPAEPGSGAEPADPSDAGTWMVDPATGDWVRD